MKHIVALIDNAESVQSRLKRIESLIEFLLEHPDAKLVAVKVRISLRLRKDTF